MIRKIFFIFIVLLFAGGNVFAEESASVSITANVEGHSSSWDDGASASTGGNTSTVVSAQSYVNCSGYAYPGAEIYLESDYQNVAIFTAGADGLFSYNVYGITAGIHNFYVYAEDLNDNYSNSVSFMVDIPATSITNISNIFIPPTLVADKTQYGSKDKIKFSGYSVSKLPVYVVVNSSDGTLRSFSKQVVSDADGYFEYVADAKVFGHGNYYVSARSLYGEIFSSFGKSVEFQIIDKISLSANIVKCEVKTDLNKDCKVNILDFFVELKWYKKSLNTEAKKRFDFNNDEKVDLADFSIMAFYWRE